MKSVHNNDVSRHLSFALVSVLIHYCSCNGRGEGNGDSKQLLGASADVMELQNRGRV
jgi:hypothetical protein